MTIDDHRPNRPTNIRERIAYELVKSQRCRAVEWLIRALACIVIVWGCAVCVVTISAVLIAILESWIL